MFDTMVATKIVGGVGGALLIFLLGNWAADSLYNTASGHGDDHAQAYVIAIEGGDTHEVEGGDAPEGAEEMAETGLAELLAAADLAAGEKIFKKCKACHKLTDGDNGVGPYLYAIVDREVASVDGFRYSGTMAELGGTWTAELLDEFLTNPKATVAGTKMTFKGLSKPNDRANLIAYLATIGG